MLTKTYRCAFLSLSLSHTHTHTHTRSCVMRYRHLSSINRYANISVLVLYQRWVMFWTSSRLESCHGLNGVGQVVQVVPSAALGHLGTTSITTAVGLVLECRFNVEYTAVGLVLGCRFNVEYTEVDFVLGCFNVKYTAVSLVLGCRFNVEYTAVGLVLECRLTWSTRQWALFWDVVLM